MEKKPKEGNAHAEPEKPSFTSEQEVDVVQKMLINEFGNLIRHELRAGSPIDTLTKVVNARQAYNHEKWFQAAKKEGRITFEDEEDEEIQRISIVFSEDEIRSAVQTIKKLDEKAQSVRKDLFEEELHASSLLSRREEILLHEKKDLIELGMRKKQPIWVIWDVVNAEVNRDQEEDENTVYSLDEIKNIIRLLDSRYPGLEKMYNPFQKLQRALAPKSSRGERATQEQRRGGESTLKEYSITETEETPSFVAPTITSEDTTITPINLEDTLSIESGNSREEIDQLIEEELNRVEQARKEAVEEMAAKLQKAGTSILLFVTRLKERDPVLYKKIATAGVKYGGIGSLLALGFFNPSILPAEFLIFSGLGAGKGVHELWKKGKLQSSIKNLAARLLRIPELFTEGIENFGRDIQEHSKDVKEFFVVRRESAQRSVVQTKEKAQSKIEESERKRLQKIREELQKLKQHADTQLKKKKKLAPGLLYRINDAQKRFNELESRFKEADTQMIELSTEVLENELDEIGETTEVKTKIVDALAEDNTQIHETINSLINMMEAQGRYTATLLKLKDKMDHYSHKIPKVSSELPGYSPTEFDVQSSEYKQYEPVYRALIQSSENLRKANEANNGKTFEQYLIESEILLEMTDEQLENFVKTLN